jgi:hypothetical protein
MDTVAAGQAPTQQSGISGRLIRANVRNRDRTGTDTVASGRTSNACTEILWDQNGSCKLKPAFSQHKPHLTDEGKKGKPLPLLN